MRRASMLIALCASSLRAVRSFSSLRVPRVLVPIADGSEEIETSCITDTLTRFGCAVTVASCGDQTLCVMSRGLKVQADVMIEEVADEVFDLIALPGGMPGAETLRDSNTLTTMLHAQSQSNRQIGAICAAPAVVLGAHGLLPQQATCYPAAKFREVIDQPADARVVVSAKENVITSQGPGTSLDFALKLGERLFSAEKAKAIRKEMLI
mmetsp:Transcript_21272/g.42473  ORF Transcript_21272/g.42473 Transcript_21272/m.42473 type:complete len:209 (+) Transcript_21272:277-903(+)